MSHPIRVLVADGDASHGESVLRRLAGRVDAIDGVFMAPHEADHIAGQQWFDAVFLDLETGSGSLQPLVHRLRGMNPEIALVGMARRLEAPIIELADVLQVVSLVGKGVDGTDLANALPKPASRPFAGTVRELSTATLFRLYGIGRMDGVLILSVDDDDGPRRGMVQLEAGQPVHATSGTRSGAEAILEMLTWAQVRVRWLPGRVPGRKTILGRWEGLLSRTQWSGTQGASDEVHTALATECPEVLEKLSRLAQTPDVAAAFLLHRRDIVMGRCLEPLDAVEVSTSLIRLAQVLADLGNTADDREIQATVAGYRLVVDRVGPADAHFQLGVVVRQAAPICKSLRRLLRQIDRAFAACDAAVRIGRDHAAVTITAVEALAAVP